MSQSQSTYVSFYFETCNQSDQDVALDHSQDPEKSSGVATEGVLFAISLFFYEAEI